MASDVSSLNRPKVSFLEGAIGKPAQSFHMMIGKDCRYDAYAWLDPIPEKIQHAITSSNEVVCSWKEACPIPKQDLAYMQIPHWDFEGRLIKGEIILHREVASYTMKVFAEAAEEGFPIEKMWLIENFGADDDRSMEANNSSGFCFRAKTGHSLTTTMPLESYSLHALGLAFDVNTLFNPYVKGNTVCPKTATAYVDRNVIKKGMIAASSALTKAVLKEGGAWGGDWKSLKDYQHYEFKLALIKNKYSVEKKVEKKESKES